MAALAIDRGGHALPSELIGPVHTTAAGVTGSLRRLGAANLVRRDVGNNRRTRPVTITTQGQSLITKITEPWQDWFASNLTRLDEDERCDLYRLLVKASGLWDGTWPDEFENNRQHG
ncbi:MAG: winged helix-turn-helix transcriptional regulator [Actinomycetia bacterium]|nr:winged helix-turn-helix transcriptional regulator [Actinomycetes bacterium]